MLPITCAQVACTFVLNVSTDNGSACLVGIMWLVPGIQTVLEVLCVCHNLIRTVERSRPQSQELVDAILGVFHFHLRSAQMAVGRIIGDYLCSKKTSSTSSQKVLVMLAYIEVEYDQVLIIKEW